MNGLTRYKQAIFLLFILIPLILSAPAAAGSQWETKEIGYENLSVVSGDISGDYIVYLTAGEGMTQTENRINLYDTGSGERKIVGIPGVNMTVTGESVSGDYAVWFETGADIIGETVQEEDLPNTVYLMNIPEGETKALGLPDDAEWPKIDGDNILWTNSSEKSFETGFYIYDIKTGKSEEVLKADCLDSAGIVYSGNRIAYEDLDALRMYDIESGKNTVVYKYESGNVSGSNIESFDMAGDVIVYMTHSIVHEGDDKGVYYEPVIYSITNGSTLELNPKTGEVSTDPFSKDNKEASVASTFTDGKRAGWGYMKSNTDSEIFLVETESGEVTTVPASGNIDEIVLDGDKMIRTVSHFPSFHTSLIYAEEKVTPDQTGSQASPGLSVPVIISGLFCIALVFSRIKRD